MGEQSHSFTSGHIWSPAMRSSRGKLFLYIAVISAICFVVFILSSARKNMKQLEGVNEKCQQQRDSLSAQLQVVYEHKNRLEKSLQQEKADHGRTREENVKQMQEQENKLQQEKDKIRALESELTQLKASYSELEVDKKHSETIFKDQMHTVKNQKAQEVKKLEAHITDLLNEKGKLEQANSALAWNLDQRSNEANLCHVQKDQLEKQLMKCNEQLQNTHVNAVANEVFRKDENMQKKVQLLTTPKSALSAGKEKINVLERPHIQLPEDNNNSSSKEDAVPKSQITNSQKQTILNQEKSSNDNQNKNFSLMKNQLPAPFNAELEKELEKKNSPAANVEPQDNNNNMNQLGQVQPPDSINQAAERGEYGNPLPGQLEQPDFRDPSNGAGADNIKRNNAVSMNDFMNNAGQVRDMLDKNPGDAEDDINIRNPHMPHKMFAIPNRMNQLNLDGHFGNQRVELPAPEDKQYAADEEEEDQEGENDEDPIGGGQGPREKHFQEPDFEDQDSNDVNAKPGEGIRVFPK